MHLMNRVSFKALRPQVVQPRHQAKHFHEENLQVEQRGLNSNVRFFVDQIISMAVNTVARKQAHTARISITGVNGAVMHVLVSTTGEADAMSFVAYTNDMCLFVGESPSLYVVDTTPRGIEHSIYLYVSQKLAGEQSVSAQISCESTSVFELPVIEGSSEAGLNSIRPRGSAAIL